MAQLKFWETIQPFASPAQVLVHAFETGDDSFNKGRPWTRGHPKARNEKKTRGLPSQEKKKKKKKRKKKKKKKKRRKKCSQTETVTGEGNFHWQSVGTTSVSQLLKAPWSCVGKPVFPGWYWFGERQSYRLASSDRISCTLPSFFRQRKLHFTVFLQTA